MTDTIIDKEAAIRFLDLLGGHERNHHFQTFDDKKKGSQATTEEGSFNDLIFDKLSVANRHGSGVFVAINTHQPKKRRLKSTTTTINALFVDFDDPETSHDQVLRAVKMLPATMVVESSPNKFHVYWALASAGSISTSAFVTWQNKLIKELDSDNAVKDTSRVMRLAGFLHQKDEPFVTRIVEEYTTGRRYSVDELVSAFYGGRNNWLAAFAGSMRRQALPQPEILAKLTDLNQSLQTPLDEDEVELISNSVVAYEPDPARVQEYNISQSAVALGLDTDKHGNIIANDRNTLKVVLAEGCVRYNLLTCNHEVVMPCQWVRGAQSPQWEDSDTNSLKHYLNAKYDCDWSSTLVDSAIDHCGINNAYDPLVDYLNSLEWDGKERVSTVLHRYLGVEASAYTAAVAECLFVGAVKRALDAGCKFDYMVVFVGEEGGGKSKFSSIIAKYPEFFTDSIGDIRSKDGVIGMVGKWIIEFPELKSLQGASSEHTKAFISTQADNIRPPYGKRSKVFPRRCIFVGSTNNEKFITDTGANRRMLPIYTPKSEESGDVLDHKMLAAEVDQLWAEAVVMYKKGHEARMPQSIMNETALARLNNTESGEYEAEIIAYMMDDSGNRVNGQSQPRTEFKSRDFYLSTEGATREKWGGAGSAVQNRVNNAAKKVFSLPEWSHYKHGRFTTGGVTWRGWKLLDK